MIEQLHTTGLRGTETLKWRSDIGATVLPDEAGDMAQVVVQQPTTNTRLALQWVICADSGALTMVWREVALLE